MHRKYLIKVRENQRREQGLDNRETQTTFGTRHKTKAYKTKKNDKKKQITYKTVKLRNTDPPSKSRMDPTAPEG